MQLPDYLFFHDIKIFKELDANPYRFKELKHKCKFISSDWLGTQCKKQKITFLIVEHRLDIALQYADYVFAMNQGKIIVQGSSDEVIKHPKVVESYMGE